ncbi:hypothetical protein HYV86_02615 [Candidatus Woesearchaeota archaeon]|nr:hypothetical protein [Candidatus Woesearchaeota archaeon]
MNLRSSVVENDISIAFVPEGFPIKQIGSLVGHGTDALLVSLPVQGSGLHEVISHFTQRSIPSFIMAASIMEREVLETLEFRGAVPLEAWNNQYWGVSRGLERIVDQEQRQSCDPAIQYNRIIKRAQDVFANPQYPSSSQFIDLMLHPRLRTLADGIPRRNGSVIIDCGHIDNRGMYATNADLFTIEDGVVLLHYLRAKGHQDVKISVLVNEQYLFGQWSKTDARRWIHKLHQQVDRFGVHQFVAQNYREILRGYGIDESTYERDIVCRFEGSLSLEARQQLAAYEEGGEHPFVMEIDLYGQRGYSFQVQMPTPDGNGSRTFERVLASAQSGAPICALISANLDRRHELAGASTVIYLRDEQWRSAVLCGSRSAHYIYGTQSEANAVFYQEKNGQVGITEIVSPIV